MAGCDDRLIGAVTPLGALRGAESGGVGEFPDLVEFADLCAKMDVGLIQLLPVNDTGFQSSPYFALTAFALHPLYIRLGDLPEARDFRDRIASLRDRFDGAARFPFEEILREKLSVLREMFRASREDIEKKAAPGGTLDEWIGKNPWVKNYAVFRRLKEANGEKSWTEWSAYRDAAKEEIAALWNDRKLRDEHLFWVWVQEAADAQFSKAAAEVKKRGIVLEGDLPILINVDSADVWAHRDWFNTGESAGAPPDQYSADGQRWGFPTYRWDVLEKDGFAFWKDRLAVAEKYYQAYRIDHVLGFFRIWTSSQNDQTSALGWFNPWEPITEKEIRALGFDADRLRWLVRPHVPTSEIWDGLRAARSGHFGDNDVSAEAGRIFHEALDRIGKEELWLFRESITCENDIEASGFSPEARDVLIHLWHNRLLVEYEKGKYSYTWKYRDSRAWASLSEKEREDVEGLIEKHKTASEKIWEKQGTKLLSMLKENAAMLPCAEDLGAVPDCVPKVLSKLGILGLRVVRWHRDWDGPGEPYYPFSDYPELSVCTPAVHDSSTLREWWEREADQAAFCQFIGVPSLPKIYNPGAAKIILQKCASAASRFRVFQIQDLLHLSPRWYAEDCASERINVPGTVGAFNWTWRLPAPIAEIAGDGDLAKAVKDLAAVKPARKKQARPAP